ncbi:MAG TPA: DUF5671 domain-containing protein [Dermatophilaceae bacterium]|nr:DUF5671 domain-containing protein [Dermatophilaceae bacterium]
MEVGLGILTGVLPILVVIGLIVWGIRKLLRRETPQAGQGRGVRRFFQYLLLYGLLWVAGIGVAGLLGRLFDLGRTVIEDAGTLALYTAFTVVGVPLYALVALWTRRRLQAEPREARSWAWHLYVTAASLSALGMAMSALHDVLSWATGMKGFSGAALASLLVWGAVWFAHWWIDRRLVPRDEFSLHRLLGSVLGLVMAVVGAVLLLGDAFRTLFGLTPETVFAGGETLFLPGAVTLAVGLPVWLVYWVVPAKRYRRSPLWLGYLLLAGVAGGLVTAIFSASFVLYDVLVWLVGDPSSSVASEHFGAAPAAVAAVLVGALVWWYHRTVLQEGGGQARTEVRRIYEYLIAGIGLVAAAVGLMLMIVALFEALAGSSDILVGSTSALNTVLAAATLLVVGGPVWWVFWHRIQSAVRATPEEEHGSPTRRIYVFVLFGVAGIAAVVALLVGVFIVLQDLFEGSVTPETLRGIRYPVGIIVAAGLLSAYHWTVYRTDREYTQAAERGPRFVLLVGPADPDIVRSLERRTGGRVQLWTRADGVGAPWSVDELAATLADRPETEDEVVVLADDQGVRVVPVDRR